MANTYTQIHIQVVFAVKIRASVITPQWKEKLHQYITGSLMPFVDFSFQHLALTG